MNITITNGDASVTYESPSGERILYSGLRNSCDLPYECATGTCGACVATKISGDSEWLWEDAPGRAMLTSEDQILMCQCIARSSLSLKVKHKVLGRKTNNSVPTPNWLAGRLTRTQEIAPDVMSLSIELSSPIRFLAGQFVVLEFGEITGFRAWSMTNFASETSSLEFVIKRKPGGTLSDLLFGGSDLSSISINIFGPLGKAFYEPDKAHDLICIAGGTGVAGMLSILKSFAAIKEKASRKADLFFGVRNNRDLFFADELQNLVRQGANAINVTIAFSDEDPDKNTKERYPLLHFEKGWVHDVARASLKTKELSNSIAYLAGPPPAVNASIRMFLLDFKFHSNRILYDKFN